MSLLTACALVESTKRSILETTAIKPSRTSIKVLDAQIKELDKAIKTQMELLPNVLISIPGIGPVISAGIIAGFVYNFKA